MSKHVDGGTSHIDDTVDADDQGDTFRRQANSSHSSEQNDHGGRRYSRYPFARYDEKEHHHQLLLPRHVDPKA